MSELVRSASDVPTSTGMEITESGAGAAGVPNVIVVQGNGPGLFIRFLWYVFIGWWLTGLSLVIGYVAGLTIIGLPLAFWIFNRTGTLLTLRPRSQKIVVDRSGGSTVISTRHFDQRELWIRAVYFGVVGWWAALIWMTLAYAVSLTLIGIPLGVMMLNRLPEIYTLHRN
jgi:uncharacterized membrane protein YccF (DUF307 family)